MLHLRTRNPAKIRLGARVPHYRPPHRHPGTPGLTEAGGDSGPAVPALLEVQLLLQEHSGPWLRAPPASPLVPEAAAGTTSHHSRPCAPQFAALYLSAWKE